MSERLKLDGKTTALVLIDLQGAVVARDTKPYSPQAVMTNGTKLGEAVRKAGGPVVYVRVLIGAFPDRYTDAPSMRPPGELPASASEIVPEAGMQEGDLLVTKQQWGAFYATNLDQLLRRRGITTIILGGIATNMGVESTARSAQERDYQLVFAEDAMSSLSAEMHESAVKTMFPRMGRVRSTEEIVAALS